MAAVLRYLPPNTCPPGGESLKDTATRVIPYFVKEIVPKITSGKTVLIVAHGNSLCALVMHIEKLKPIEVEHMEIPTGLARNIILMSICSSLALRVSRLN